MLKLAPINAKPVILWFVLQLTAINVYLREWCYI